MRSKTRTARRRARPSATRSAAAAAVRRPPTALQPADARAAHPPDVRVALDAFRRIVQALRVVGAGRGHAGLGSAQLFALQRIAEYPDASINDVAALTCTHQSSVSAVIQRLVQQRLVAKLPSADDRRRQRLAVTAKGRRLLSRTPAAVQGHLIAAIAALPAADRGALAKSLSAVARLVAPDDAASHPPMFFEDQGPDRRTVVLSTRTR